ncbi:restriction endonuclease subunit S [Mucilaginibacter rigui]|uniref:Restriction endonuclease subunit S n=1 Tax=Mucilaginibacter rigui TaxID=534635 RepID=A0ABR7X1X4_9SPHI|nr:restriction endonuclease subunit S [Mucilaginibacter rigui]MBD1384597.1 restriction endonuclease subunit S [Mucilaginibacter rigui]
MIRNKKEEDYYFHERFGMVPNGWEVKKLGECFDFFPTSSYSREKLTDTGECLYVHYGDIHLRFQEFIDFENEQLPFVTKEMATRFTKLKDGDLIIADASEDYDGVGKAIEVVNLGNQEAIAGLHTLHLRAKDHCFVNGFKGYVLNNEKVRLDILRSATGIKVYSISKGGLKKILLPKPPKPEQEAISSILSKVDKAIKATQSSLKALEKLKLGLTQNLLSGKLKPDGSWRNNDEFYNDEKLGLVPIGWISDRIKNVTNRVTDGEHLSPEFQETGAYILSAEDIKDDGVSFEKATFVRPQDCKKFRNRCNPEFGDVLIVSRGASIGRTCKVNTTVEFCLMGSVILIKPDNEKLHGGFLAQYFKSYQAWIGLQRLSGTTAQQAIYLTHIKKGKNNLSPKY